jgi:hypothetical protein
MLMSNKISIMAKRLKLATRAFGAEPGRPEVAALAEWIAVHRGTTADIITYQLHQSLAPQIPRGIMTPCAGGKFYTDRIRQCLANITDNKATGELHVDTEAIIEDAAGIVVQRKGAWCAIPAPHLLGIDDAYYHNADEWNDAICGAYLTMMRAMRDSGVAGHVLIGDRMDEAELAAFSRQKVFFFQPEPDREDLATLMEHQRQVAVGKDQVQTVFDLTDEYTLRKIFIIGPDRESVNLALDYLDPDQIVAGGYCTEGCGEYWKDLVAAAVYER